MVNVNQVGGFDGTSYPQGYTNQSKTFIESFSNGNTPFLDLLLEPSGTTARTIQRHNIATASLAAYTTGGQVAANALVLPAGLQVNNVAVLTGGTGATGPTHFWTGLTDANLNVLAVSSDQGSGAIAGSTVFKLAMSSPYVIPTTGLYYVVASVSASTTAPTAAGAALAGGVAGMAPIMCGSAGTQATPPTVGTQLNSGAVTQNGNMNIAAWIS